MTYKVICRRVASSGEITDYKNQVYENVVCILVIME